MVYVLISVCILFDFMLFVNTTNCLLCILCLECTQRYARSPTHKSKPTKYAISQFLQTFNKKKVQTRFPQTKQQQKGNHKTKQNKKKNLWVCGFCSTRSHLFANKTHGIGSSFLKNTFFSTSAFHCFAFSNDFRQVMSKTTMAATAFL